MRVVRSTSPRFMLCTCIQLSATVRTYTTRIPTILLLVVHDLLTAMERAQSFSGAQRPSSTSGAPFPYQQKLLDRPSSTRSGSLSRSGSQTNNLLLSKPTGAPNRRWTPGHRSGASLDTVRGKWEDRTRPETPTEGRTPVSDSRLATATFESAEPPQTYSSSRTMEIASRLPYTADTATFTSVQRSSSPEEHRTPTALKRHTLPAIIASPLSPNTTGVTIENPDSTSSPFSSPTPNRIRLPLTPGFASPSTSVSERIHNYPFGRDEKRSEPSTPTPTLRSRSHTIDNLAPTSTGSSTASDATSSSSITSASSRTLLSDTSSNQSRQQADRVLETCAISRELVLGNDSAAIPELLHG
ncbi:hypothetical protein BC835DRAFT_20268 [Cytidiella melzeri]|nr:hypothetical protein BC835DRAFT_20268 [Cytidiella melzeri]